MSVITVDFDETLAESGASQVGILWTCDGGLVPIPRVINYVKKLIEEGNDVYVVTFRSEEYRDEVLEFLEEEDIKVKGVICTEGKTKTPFLKELNSTLHIDDNVEVLVLAEMAGIKGLLVDWDQEKTNSSALLFEKI